MSEFFQWQYWVALALVLIILEIFVPGFVLFCLGVGCIGGAVAEALGFGINIQLTAFALLALLSFFLVRPVLMRRFWKDDGLGQMSMHWSAKKGK